MADHNDSKTKMIRVRIKEYTILTELSKKLGVSMAEATHLAINGKVGMLGWAKGQVENMLDAIILLQQNYDDEEALEQAKENKEPWLERVHSAH